MLSFEQSAELHEDFFVALDAEMDAEIVALDAASIAPRAGLAMPVMISHHVTVNFSTIVMISSS